jgi:lipid II:glycine glycyltransferase (peptidoglycan interpeptide bridge formation enzyme)
MMKPRRHFLQTDHWAAFQKSIKRKVIDEKGDGWRFLAIVESGRLGTRLYCPYGPTATTRSSLAQAMEALEDIARENQALFIRVEPVAPIKPMHMRRLGAIKSPVEIQPELTWRVGLTPSEDEIITNMKPTNRNLHRTASKKGLTFRKSNKPSDMKHLLKFIHQTAKRAGITPHPDWYFKKQAQVLMPRGAAHLFLAEYEKQPIAAAFVYDSNTTRYYAHAGSDFANRKLHAGTPLVSHMMIDAKRSGLKYFDMYGIAPENQQDHPWAGFTKFKKSFGGESYEYVGTWDVPINGLIYRAYRLGLTFKNKFKV